MMRLQLILLLVLLLSACVQVQPPQPLDPARESCSHPYPEPVYEAVIAAIQKENNGRPVSLNRATLREYDGAPSQPNQYVEMLDSTWTVRLQAAGLVADADNTSSAATGQVTLAPVRWQDDGLASVEVLEFAEFAGGYGGISTKRYRLRKSENGWDVVDMEQGDSMFLIKD